MSKLVAIGSVCRLQNGRAFKPTEWAEGGTPIIRIQNLNDHSKPFNYCAFEVEDRFHVNSGDLLFSWSGTPGTSFGAFLWSRGKGFLNQHIFRVDVNERLISKEYLKLALNAKLRVIMDQAHGGVGLQHITKGKLESVEIPLPSLAEQRRIAAILDKADALRVKRREALAQVDVLGQAIFVEMFENSLQSAQSLRKVRLSEISEFENGDRSSNYPSGDDIKPNGILFVNTKNIKNKRLDLSEPTFISREKFQSLSRGKARRDDILISLRGTLGNCCLFRCDANEAFINAQLMIIRPHEAVLPEFLLAYLSLPKIQDHFQRIGRGAAVPQLTAKQLSELEISIPDICRQEQFVARLRKVDSMRFIIAQSLQTLDGLFQSLQHRAFTGTL